MSYYCFCLSAVNALQNVQPNTVTACSTAARLSIYRCGRCDATANGDAGEHAPPRFIFSAPAILRRNFTIMCLQG